MVGFPRAGCADPSPSPSWPRSSDVRTSSSGSLAPRSKSDCASGLVGSSSAQARTGHCLSLFRWGPRGGPALLRTGEGRAPRHHSRPGKHPPLRRMHAIRCAPRREHRHRRRRRCHGRQAERHGPPRHPDRTATSTGSPTSALSRIPRGPSPRRGPSATSRGTDVVPRPEVRPQGASEGRRARAVRTGFHRRAGEGGPSFPARPAPASTCSPATRGRSSDRERGEEKRAGPLPHDPTPPKETPPFSRGET